MTREDDKTSYTEEDLRHIEVKEYNKEELKENISKVKGKRIIVNITSTIFGMLTFVFMIMLIFVADDTLKQVKICGVDLFFIYFIAYMVYAGIFVCIAINNISDIKMAKCKNYFEVEVLEKLPIESYSYTSIDSGTHTDYFYPIKGKDSNNGYETVLYISEEKYENADIGDYIKLPLREDTVIRMMNRR